MRPRFRTMRDRTMARRPSGEGRFTLSRRQRLVAGWLAAIGVFLLIALAVRLLGGDGDGTPVVPSSSASNGIGHPQAIAFGTELDATTGMVPENAHVSRFAAGDTFAYSVTTAGDAPAIVYVGVERVGGGATGVVQDAATEGEQDIPEGRPTIGFTVPATVLLEAFGPGEYVMRIHVDPAEDPVAEGRFVLVGEPAASPSGS